MAGTTGGGGGAGVGATGTGTGAGAGVCGSGTLATGGGAAGSGAATGGGGGAEAAAAAARGTIDSITTTSGTLGHRLEDITSAVTGPNGLSSAAVRLQEEIHRSL